MEIKVRKLKAQYIFLILGLIYGTAFLFAIPPFQVPDEYEHYYRAWDLSEGNFIPEKVGNKAGIYLPKSVKIATDNVYQKWMFYIKNKHKIDLNYLINMPLKNDDKIFTDISKYAVITYSPLPYLAPSLGMGIGKALNLSPLMLMYLGRFANLLLWLFIIFLSIKLTPVFKWGFILLSLTPMTLFQVASISADSITIALSFLLIAISLNFALDKDKEKISKKEISILFLIILLLSLAKLPYFLLIFLFFLIPSSKFGSKTKMLSIFIFLFSSAVVVIFAWNLMVKGLYMPVNFGVSASDQFFYVSQSPLEFIQIIFNTLTVNLHDFPIIHVGNWAFGNSPLPMWIYRTNLIMLITIALFYNNGIKINFKQRYVIIGTFLLVTGLIFFIEYITWTEVGKKIIYGLQGRYFIPLVPLAFLFFNNSTDFSLKKLDFIIVAYIIFSLTAVIFIFINKYYV